MSFENGPSINNPEVSDTSSFDENQEPEIQDDYDSEVQEQELERLNRLSISLGDLSLEGTVELQPEQPEEPESAEPKTPEDEAEVEYGDDYNEDDTEDGEKDEDEDEGEKDKLLRKQEEELEHLRKKTHQQKQRLNGEDLTDDSTRDAALDFVYLVTGAPVNEMQ